MKGRSGGPAHHRSTARRWGVGGLVLLATMAVTSLAPPGRLGADVAHAESRTVCLGAPVPEGWVITSTSASSLGCQPSSGINAFIVSTPSDGITVCSGSPIPPGYVRLSDTTTFSCGTGFGSGVNAIVIGLPPSGDIICVQTPRPADKVVVGFEDRGGCSGASPNAQRVAVPAQGMTVCPSQGLPPGWESAATVTQLACNQGGPATVNNAVVLKRTPNRPLEGRCAADAQERWRGPVTHPDGGTLGQLTAYHSPACNTYWTNVSSAVGAVAVHVTVRDGDGNWYTELGLPAPGPYDYRGDLFFLQAIGVVDANSLMVDAGLGYAAPPEACAAIRLPDDPSYWGVCRGAGGQETRRFDTVIFAGGVEEPPPPPPADPPPVDPPPPPGVEPTGEWVGDEFIPYDELYPLPEPPAQLPPGIGGPLELPCNTPGLVLGDAGGDHVSVYVVPENEDLAYIVNLGPLSTLLGGWIDVRVWADGVEVQRQTGPALAGVLGDEIGGLLGSRSIRIRAELRPQPTLFDPAPAPQRIADDYCAMPDQRSLWVPGGGLLGHEHPFGGGLHPTGGHTLAVHVGRDLQFLAERLDRKRRLRAASTFDDQADAEHWIHNTLNAQPPGFFVNWLNDPQEERLPLTEDFGLRTGDSLLRGSTQLVPVTGVFVLVVKDNTNLGWHVQTAYPTFPTL